MNKNNHQLTRIIHWLSAVLIIGLLSSGIYMSDGHDYSFYDWHKSFGVIALLLIALRIHHRRNNPWQSSAQGTKHEQVVHLMHRFLIWACVLMPISGIVYSGLSGHGVEVFGIPLIFSNYNSAAEAMPYNLWLSDFGKLVHTYLGYTMAVLVTMHVLAALKHHIVDKDLTLKRMLSSRY